MTSLPASLGDLDLRPVKDEEWRAFVRAGEMAFHEEVADSDVELFRIRYPLERTLAVFEGTRILGTTGSYDFRMAVPGGRDLPTAGVTSVGVSPTHRRRGLLTAMMDRQLTDLHEWGEPLAALWASEAPIYGRFGYGLASWTLAVEVPRAGNRFVPGVEAVDGRLRLVDPDSDDAWQAIVAVESVTRAVRPGRYARDAEWLRRTLADPPHWRKGASPLQVLVHDGPDGPDGYALYRVHPEWDRSVPAGEARVREVDATSPAVYATLWRFLLDIDLVDRTTAIARPLDDPLLALLADPRRVRPVLRDNLFLRLVDVPVALAGRTYARPVDVVLDVADPVCPWNARRWRLSGDESGATCAATSDPADLSLSSAGLAAAYLGGPALRSLADAGQVHAARPAALAAASAAFHCDVAPYCPEVF